MGVKVFGEAAVFEVGELLAVVEDGERDLRASLILCRLRTLFSLSSDGLSVSLSSTVPSALRLGFADVGETGDGVVVRSGEAGRVVSEL